MPAPASPTGTPPAAAPLPPPPPQRLLGPEDTLYFLHVPKAAGTTIRTFFEDHFDLDRICPHFVFDDIVALPPGDLARYRLICGHHGWFLHSMLPPAHPLHVVTMLRDPLERSLSHYYHQRNSPDNWLHQIVRDWSFESYVHHPLGISELVNFQVRHLALDRIQEDYWEHSLMRDRDIDALIAKYSDPRLLDRAVERLESMAAFGLAERMTDSIRLIGHVFGWPEWTRPPRHNARVSERDPGDLTSRAVEQVRRLTALDYRLYERAGALFEQRVAALGPDLVSRAYSDAMATRPRVSSVRYGFDRALTGDGWYPRSERRDGPVNRWTGPANTAFIDLPLEAGRDLRIAFHVGAYDPEQVRSARLFVNNEEVPLSRWQVRYGSDNEAICRGVLTRTALARGNGYSRLRFETCRPVRPCDVDPRHYAGDQRSLALHFRWIEIDPA